MTSDSINSIELALFSARIQAICEEMGAVLQRTAVSPNIRDRLDYSCAIFNADGLLCAQAAHIPVHLGSMAFAMQDIVRQIDWHPGDMVILNDPYLGGTHLPDITLIAPLFVQNDLQGFVCNRAHHADIGASTPGSMPLASRLQDEGVIIAPTRFMQAGEINRQFTDEFYARLRQPQNAEGDFSAQASANRCGLERLHALIDKQGQQAFSAALDNLNDYAERLARSRLQQIPDGIYLAEDFMDGDGIGDALIPIRLQLKVCAGNIVADFTGSAAQVAGNINCPLSVTAAAVLYVFRCLMPANTPGCAGAFRPVQIQAPSATLVNASAPAAVAAGNVETSSRVVDVVLQALATALPDSIPAASQGSMNNIALGSQSWDYYETLAGGMGAHASGAGQSAVQTHMTNTLNTPVEILEMHYPLRIESYQQRHDSGGAGQHCGGDGIIREYRFLQDAHVSLLTERRKLAPPGLNGGMDGAAGNNLLDSRPLPGKTSCQVKAGSLLRIETPGGGGWGCPAAPVS